MKEVYLKKSRNAAAYQDLKTRMSQKSFQQPRKKITEPHFKKKKKKPAKIKITEGRSTCETTAAA